MITKGPRTSRALLFHRTSIVTRGVSSSPRKSLFYLLCLECACTLLSKRGFSLRPNFVRYQGRATPSILALPFFSRSVIEIEHPLCCAAHIPVSSGSFNRVSNLPFFPPSLCNFFIAALSRSWMFACCYPAFFLSPFSFFRPLTFDATLSWP